MSAIEVAHASLHRCAAMGTDAAGTRAGGFAQALLHPQAPSDAGRAPCAGGPA
jgi:hypothetical protein